MNPYLLLTPGPLSTSASVKETMLRDWCTWDDDYNLGVVQDIRARLTALSGSEPAAYTCVLMQGSGSFSVEAALGTFVPRGNARLLICANGAYGERMITTATVMGLSNTALRFGETDPVDPARLAAALAADPTLTHVAVVHNETTTGMMNPLPEIAAAVKIAGRVLLVDAMSSFGGVPIDMAALGIDVLVSSANKCIQGVPGFGFVLARRSLLETCAGNSRSHSLDLHDQWQTMEKQKGKWRFTSPTHVVRAFQQALNEFDAEGGVPARHARYSENQRILVDGMEALGFRCLLPRALHSPIITSFHNPESPAYTFRQFYDRLKARGFVIYPGKVSNADCFRIGTIGEVVPNDIRRLLAAVEAERFWM
jgi:2-aminoethylphosphonate-pyruvate transaminase